MASRLASIRRKLVVLARRAEASPSTRGAGWQVRPPLGERSVRRFERRYGVELPAGYRGFVTEVASGAPGPAGAVPPLARSVDRAFVARHPRHLARPFPFTGADASRILRIQRDEDRDHGELCPCIDERRPVTGALDVGEWNAGGCAALVVADGDQHGRVWFNGHHPGWSSTMPYHREWQPLDFLDWYEDWLDDRLQPGAMRRNPDRPLAAATHLDFCYPRSPIVPAWVWRCARVRELSFWHNDPVALPAALGGLRELRRLTLRCPLTTLPAAIGRLRRLEAVNLGFCYLPALPDELCRLSRMRTLNLDGNSLRCLPAHMGDLQRLEWLTVRWNRLDALPGSFAELRELRVLSLDQNRLVRLPARFHQLARLGGLDLGRNPIDLAATCEVLARLPRLRMLVLPALAPAADLAPLAALGGLRRLTLHAATRTQRAAIQRLLPDVELRLMGGGEW